MALAIGDDATTARGYQYTQLTLTFLGRHDEALKVADEARARLRACGDQVGELMLRGAARAPAPAGRAARRVGRRVRGGLGHARAGSPASSGSRPTCTTSPASRCSRCRAGKRTASCMLRKGLAGKQELGDIVGMAYAIDGLGWLAQKTGSPCAGRLADGGGGGAVGARRRRAVQRDRDHGGVPPAGGGRGRRRDRRAGSTRRSSRPGPPTCGSCLTPRSARARCGWTSRNGWFRACGTPAA